MVENVARVTVETYEREGFTNLELIPEITAFLQRDFGHLILSHLMLTLREDPSLGAWARAPASELYTRFGVSRAHVRNVLQMGEDLGLVKGQTRGGRMVRLTPRFVELTRQWVAIDLAWMRYLAEGSYVHARRHAEA
ncbi:MULTISPECIES: hypothetical protein [Brevundimonas]|uniref:HTH gntR-type domain-containing protein n=1 Tax=Brevundimonas abyssalis TAR-001 TaxID=1391729 RepID=A0A8E0NDS4_9CAUL|nr:MULTISPECIES: hypothetical protein [Brevundimonas]GAD60524.1 hypothetical protein MBEBAB_2774 [Brevundimonas abyssalis TAR-001]